MTSGKTVIIPFTNFSFVTLSDCVYSTSYTWSPSVIAPVNVEFAEMVTLLPVNSVVNVNIKDEYSLLYIAVNTVYEECVSDVAYNTRIY